MAVYVERLDFLTPKLPAPEEQDLSRGILQAIDLDSYRAEKKAALKIALADEDAEIGPVTATGGGHIPEPELERLSSILRAFNEQYGTLFKQMIDDNEAFRRGLTETVFALTYG